MKKYASEGVNNGLHSHHMIQYAQLIWLVIFFRNGTLHLNPWGINILPRTCQLLVCEESTPTACTVIVYDGCAGNSSAKLDSWVVGHEHQTKLLLPFLYSKVILNGDVDAELHGWACECELGCSAGKVYRSWKWIKVWKGDKQTMLVLTRKKRKKKKTKKKQGTHN